MPCLISLILLSLFAACAPPPREITPSPIEVTDQLGRIVKLDKIPQRIISLAPSNTEILFALGLSDSIVAVTDYCDYPPEVEDKSSIGGFSTPNIEEVVAHSPNLILAASIHEDKIIPQLEQKGLTVLALKPKTLDEVLAAITLVGDVTGKEREASELLAKMQGRIKAVTGNTARLTGEQRPRVLYYIWHDPLKVAGSGTLQDELIQKAGGTNIARNLTDYADISLEAVIDANPEVMIASVSHGSSRELTFQFIGTEPRLKDTAARQNNRIYMVDGNLVSRAGPRIVDGLETFARFIHPELFKQTQ
ncbi:ABC transporter substrate-binding protein [Chloroflexota bacterium]